MKRSSEVYQKIDNKLYDYSANHWWDDESDMLLLKYSVNPVRVPYFQAIIDTSLPNDKQSYNALEVGCGGGYLTEEISKMGFRTWGIDPSAKVLEAASDHALKQSFDIKYNEGRGEAIPFEDGFFDVVFCCDVLEHVEDVEKTLQEVSRVLKNRGLFFFDTINRTWLSWLLMIKVLQDWPHFSFMPDRLHVWEMFIKPKELTSIMEGNQMILREFYGMVPQKSFFKIYKAIRGYKKGAISFKELANLMILKKSKDLNISYMGYGVKK